MKSIPGFEGYFATEDGNIFRDHPLYGVIKIYANTDSHGYLALNLPLGNGKYRRTFAHRLVAAAFLPDFSDALEVNHKNGKRKDNRIQNLEMVTHAENMRHAAQVLKRKFQWSGDQNSRFKGAIIGIHKKSGKQVRFIGKQALLEAGFNPSSIYDCFAGRQASHKGYAWRHEEAARKPRKELLLRY